MTDLLPSLRSLLAGQSPGSGAHDTLEQAVAELVHLRRQRDDLQRRGTELVEENRRLKAPIAGRPVVRIKRVGSPDLQLPEYATAGAAGMDLRADLSKYHPVWGQILGTTGRSTAGYLRSVDLRSGGRALIPCGFAFEIPEGWEGQVRGRSGCTSRGVYAITGTVDSDYRGEVCIHIHNGSSEPVTIQHGDRIAQLVICPAPQARLEEAVELSESARGEAGFGSTGVR